VDPDLGGKLQPSMVGMRRSATTRSTGRRLSTEKTAAPFGASHTAYPATSNMRHRGRINMWVGVAKAEYSAAEEAPIFLVVFAIPAAIAILFAWWLART